MAKKEERQCGSCGAKGMVYGRRNVTRYFEGTPLTIPDVDGWLCSVCGEVEFADAENAQRFFEQVTEQQQQERKRQAAELRAIRKRLKLTQRQAAELLGGGANAFSDYERGIVRPSRSTVLLLQLLDHHPELLHELQDTQGR